MSRAMEVSGQYAKATKNKVVVDAHRNIETITVKEMKKAGHVAPRRFGKIIRLTSDTLDNLEPAQLELLARRPKIFEQRFLKFLKMYSITTTPTPPEKKAMVVGENINLKLLSTEESRAPLAEDTEIVGEDNPLYSTMSTVEVGKILKISRTTVIQWIDTGKIIGIKGMKRGWRIPKAQIKGARLAPGLKAVSDLFSDSEITWHFLVSQQLFGEKRARPIDLLFKKETELVARLAEGYGSDFL